MNVAPAAAAMATLAPLLVPALAAGCNAKGAGAKTAARGCLQCLRQSLGAQRFKRAVETCRDKSVTKAQLQAVLDASYSGPDADAPLPPGFALLDNCSPAALSRVLAIADAASPGVGSRRSPRSGANNSRSKSGAGALTQNGAAVPASPSPRTASSSRGLGRISSGGNDRIQGVDRGRSLDRSSSSTNERGFYRGAVNVLPSPTAEFSAGAAAAVVGAAAGLQQERSQWRVGRFSRDKPSAGAALQSSAAQDYTIVGPRGRSAPRPASPTGAPPALPFMTAAAAAGSSSLLSPEQAPPSSSAFPVASSSSSFAVTAFTSAAAHKAAAALSRAKAAASRERAASASSRLHPRESTPPPAGAAAASGAANTAHEMKNSAATGRPAHVESQPRRGRVSSASATSRFAASKGSSSGAGDSSGGSSGATPERSRRSAVPSYSDLLKSPGLPLRESLSALNAAPTMASGDTTPTEPQTSTPEATPPRKREASMSTTPLPSPPVLKQAPLSPLHAPPPLALRPPVPQEAKPNPRLFPLGGGDSDALLRMAEKTASSADAATEKAPDTLLLSTEKAAETATRVFEDAAAVQKEAEQLRSALEKGELAAWELPGLVAECVAEGEFTPSQGEAIMHQLDASNLPLEHAAPADEEAAATEAVAPLVLLEPPTGPLVGPPLIDPCSDNIWDIAERANSLSPPSLRAMNTTLAAAEAEAPSAATVVTLERLKQPLSRSVSALSQTAEGRSQGIYNGINYDDDDDGVLTPEASDPQAAAATSWLVRPLVPTDSAYEPISKSFDSGIGSNYGSSSSSSSSGSDNYGYNVQSGDSVPAGALRTSTVKTPPCNAAPNSSSSSTSRASNKQKKNNRNSTSSSSSSSASSGRAASVISSPPSKLPNAKVQSPLALLATQYLDNRSRSRSRARPASETTELSPVAHSDVTAREDARFPSTSARSTYADAVTSKSSFTVTFTLQLTGAMSKSSSVRTLRAVCAAELSVRPNQVTVNTVPSASSAPTAAAATEVEVRVGDLATAKVADAVVLRCTDPDALREGLSATGFGDGTFTRKPKVQPPGPVDPAPIDPAAAAAEGNIVPASIKTTAMMSATAASEAVPPVETDAPQTSCTAVKVLGTIEATTDSTTADDIKMVGGTLRTLGEETRSRSSSTTESLGAENPLLAEAEAEVSPSSSSSTATDSPKLLPQAPLVSGPPVVARPPSIRMRGAIVASTLKAKSSSSSGGSGTKPRWIPRAALNGPPGASGATTAKATAKKSTAAVSSPPSSPEASAAAAAAAVAGLTLGRPMVARGSLPSPRGSASSVASTTSTSSSAQSGSAPNTASLRPRLLACANTRPNNSQNLDAECSGAQSPDAQNSDGRIANDGSEDGVRNVDSGDDDGVRINDVSSSAADKYPERQSFDSMASSTMGLYAEALSATRAHKLRSESLDQDIEEVSEGAESDDRVSEADDVDESENEAGDEESSVGSDVDNAEEDAHYTDHSVDVEEMLQSMALASPQTSSFDGRYVGSLADDNDEGNDNNDEENRHAVDQVDLGETFRDGDESSVSDAGDINEVQMTEDIPEIDESKAVTEKIDEANSSSLESHSNDVFENDTANNDHDAVNNENTASNGNTQEDQRSREEKRRNDLKANARRLLMKNQLGKVKAHVAFQSPAAPLSADVEEESLEEKPKEIKESELNDGEARSNEEPTNEEVVEPVNVPDEMESAAQEDGEVREEGKEVEGHTLSPEVTCNDGLSTGPMPMDFSAAELRSAFNEQCSLVARREVSSGSAQDEETNVNIDNTPDETVLPEVPRDQLNCAAFCALVQSLLKQRGFAANAADLQAAFDAADSDQSGGVDVFEFVRLFDLVQSGLVHGFGQRRHSASSHAGNTPMELRKQDDALNAIAVEGDTSSPASEQDVGNSGNINEQICKSGSAPFVEGDTVFWDKSDEDIPAGTSGRVLRVHYDGDVEVLFADAIFTFQACALRRFPMELSQHEFQGDEEFNFSPKPMAVQKCSCVVS